MKHIIGILLGVVLTAAQLGMAQTETPSKHVGQAYGYGAIGGVVEGGGSSAISQMGGGAEGIFYKGLGAAIDGGYLFPIDSFSAGFGTLSPGLSYSFSHDEKLVPFATGGYTLGFRIGSGTMSMVHFGGGVTYWFAERAGVRIEARDHVPIEAADHHYLVVRFGISFR